MAKSAFLHRLENPESVKARPDYEVLLKCITQKRPDYTPPDLTNDVAKNAAVLRQMAMDAYEANPMALVNCCLSRTITSLARLYCRDRAPREQNAEWRAMRPISITEFRQEAVAWYARHLTDCAADKRSSATQPAARELRPSEDRTMDMFASPKAEFANTARKKSERPRGISTNCLAYWNPKLGGLITHVREYSKYKLHPSLLEHMVEQRRTDGTISYSLEEAAELLDRSGFKGYRPWDETALPLLAPVASMNKAIGDREKGPPTNERILAWVQRNCPEMEEGMVRGARSERIASLKAAVAAILKQHAGELPNGRTLSRGVKSWDPRSEPIDEKYPEIASVLERDEKRSIIAEKLEREGTRNMFDLSVQMELGGSREDRARGWWENEARWAEQAKPTALDSKVLEESHAFFEKAGSNEMAREKMHHFIEQAFAPDPKSTVENAEIIESLRVELLAQNEKWDFSRRGPDVLLGCAIKSCCGVSNPEQEHSISGTAFDRIASYHRANQVKTPMPKKTSRDDNSQQVEMEI